MSKVDPMLGQRPDDLIRVQEDTDPRRMIVLSKSADALPLDGIRCPDLSAVATAWLDLPREPGACLPRWSTFRPADFKSALPKFCILTIEDHANDQFDFSLYGEHATQYIGAGQALTLKRARRFGDRSGNYDDIRKRVIRTVENAAPQYARKALAWNEHGYVDYELLMLPFLPENGKQRLLQPLTARTTLGQNFPDRDPSGTVKRAPLHAA